MITFDYRNRTALVTGAGRGLGLAIAQALHAAGAEVIVNDREPEAVAAAVARIGSERVISAPADLSTAEGAAAAIAPAIRRGKLDILVNNAAINIERSIFETDDAHWDRHLSTNLKAAFFTVGNALPLLRRSQGVVINVASELGLHAIANNVAYVAAKHGLLAMTRAMAIELAPDIRVNALCPGTMDTELMRDCAVDSGDSDAYYRAFRAYHPLGRLATPEEIAQFVLCLLAPAAAFATGAAFVIDGGSTSGRR